MVAGVYCNRLYALRADNGEKKKESQETFVQGVFLNGKICFETCK